MKPYHPLRQIELDRMMPNRLVPEQMELMVAQHEKMMQWMVDMLNQLDLRVTQLEHKQAAEFVALPIHPYLSPEVIDDENSRYS